MTKRQKKFMRAMRPYMWTMWNEEIAATCNAMEAHYTNYHIAEKKITGTAAMRIKLISLSESQNHRCCYCGVNTWHPDIYDGGSISRSCLRRATIEHVISKSKGGTNNMSNLVMACYECNSVRGNTDYEDFIKVISEPVYLIEPPKKKEPKNDNETNARIFKRLLICAILYPTEFQQVLEYVEESDFYNSLINRKPKKFKNKKIKRLNIIRARVHANGLAIAA